MSHNKNNILITVLVAIALIIPSSNSFAYDKFLPNPATDTFFRNQFLNNKLKPGTILEQRNISQDAYGSLYQGIRYEQLAFVTKDSFNRKVRATASLLLPPNFNNATQIIEYNPWIDSLGTQCNPGYEIANSLTKLNSYDHYVSNRTTLEFMKYLIDNHKNYALLVTDDTGANLEFGANYLSGHLALDAIRAIKQYPKYNFSTKKVVVYGYSGGGMVAAWAAALEKKYAPDLKNNIAGYVAGGIPSNLMNLATYYNIFGGAPKAAFGIAIALLGGINREYPNFNLSELLNEQGTQLMNQVKNQCFMSIVLKGMNKSGTTIVKTTDKKSFNKLIPLAKLNSLTYINDYPIKPMVVMYATKDTEVPQGPTVKLVKRWKKQGAKIFLKPFAGDHGDIEIKQNPWIVSRIDAFYR